MLKEEVYFEFIVIDFRDVIDNGNQVRTQYIDRLLHIKIKTLCL